VRRGVRAFTLVELMIVIAVIATLMSLVLGVGSALLRNAERSQVESAMAIMESAMNEYEAQMGRQMTFNGAWPAAAASNSAVLTGPPFPDALFDVRDPGPAPNWMARAAGAGVYAVNLMRQYEAIRPILAGISTSLLRGEPNASTYPPTTTAGGGMYLPAAKAAAGNVSSRAEFVDSWGNRIAFVFPGRVFRFGVDQGVPDQDGTITTCIERRIGVCTNRRVCLVSPGPDGVFGVDGEPGMTGTTAAIAQARQQAASDNVLLYPLDPPP
jgi:prepilin-type N-terminal cleavage/methylation domain-containing protein